MSTKTQLQTRAAPASFDEEEGTIEVVYATETSVSRYGYVEQLVVDEAAIDASRLDSGSVNLLVQHDAWNGLPIGNVIEHRIADGMAIAKIKLSVAKEHQGIVDNLKAGVIRTVSVGYSVIESEETVADDGVITQRVTKWMPAEISLVSIPADHNARTRSAPASQLAALVRRTITAAAPNTKGKTMFGKKQKRTAAEEAAAEVEETVGEELTEEQTAAVEEAVEEALAEVAEEIEADAEEPAEDAANPEADGAKDEADATRSAQILDLCTRHGLSTKFALRHVRAGTPVTKVQAAVLDAIAERSAPPMSNARIRRDERETLQRHASTAIYSLISGKPVKDDEVGSLRSASLVEIARSMIGSEAQGRSNADVIRMAIRGGMHTSSDFSFTSAVGGGIDRRVREIFESLEMPLQPLVRDTLVSDFKPVSTYSIGGFPELLETPEGGEYQAGTVSTEAGQFSISKYGRVLSLSFEAIINDDLRLLDTAIRGAASKGRALRNKKVREAFGAKLGDGKAVFHASRGNLISDELTVDGLSKARTALRKVRNIDGDAMDLAPKFLVVGPELETTADRLISPITAAVSGEVNPFASNLTLIVDPMFENQEWMVAADPNFGDAIELADLRGYTGVQVEEILNPMIDGISYRARTFAGAHPTGWRGFVKSTGTGA